MPTARRTACVLALLAAAPLAAQPTDGSATARLVAHAPRVLFASLDSVKTDDGSHAWVRTVLRYDPVAGTYAHRIKDAEGRTLSERVTTMTLAAPTEAEEAAAQSLIRSHPEIARLVADAAYPVEVEGGFPLVHEAGAACGPGSRCLSYDVLEQAPDATRRLRYVVVDLRDLTVVSADADPVADGNLAHPAARRQSRTQ